MAASWTDEETFKLIDFWSEDAIQAMLEGCRRNKDIFLRISQEMDAAGFAKTGQQCSGKIKKLRFDYRKIKDCRGKETGRGGRDGNLSLATLLVVNRNNKKYLYLSKE